MTSWYKYAAPKKDERANPFQSNYFKVYKIRSFSANNYNLLLPVSLGILIIITIIIIIIIIIIISTNEIQKITMQQQ